MSQPIPPEDRQILNAGYILNDLSAEEAALLASLPPDPAADQEIAELQRALEASYLSEEVQPSPQLREAIMMAARSAAVSQEPPHAVADTPPPLRLVSPPLPRWVRMSGAIAASAIVALSASNYWLWRSLQTQQAQLAQPTVTVALQPTDALSSPAQVVVDLQPTQLRGTLRIENLPPLEPGKVYVLWTLLDPDAPFTTDDKNAILTHVFSGTGQAEGTQDLTLPSAFQQPGVVRAIAITIEDASAPQRHAAAPILIQQL